MTERMTPDQLRDLQAKKGTKRVLNAEPVTVDGITFHSKREAKRWGELVLMQKAGEIGTLRRQVPFPLFGRDDDIKTETGRQMRYIADFVYWDNRINATVVEDAKGWATEVFKIKRAILKAQGVEVQTV